MGLELIVRQAQTPGLAVQPQTAGVWPLRGHVDPSVLGQYEPPSPCLVHGDTTGTLWPSFLPFGCLYS